MTQQLYDAEGTVRLQYTYLETNDMGEKKKEWCVIFTQGHIHIGDDFGINSININFPQEHHWTYEEQVVTPQNGSYVRRGKIKGTGFTLRACVCEYKHIDAPDFNPEYDIEGTPESYLDIDSGTIHMTISIPYGLALSLIKLMSGSTNFERVIKTK